MANIKNQYYPMTKSEFDKYLYEIKDDSKTIHFFKNRNKDYFYYAENDCIQTLVQLHSLKVKFDQLINTLSANVALRRDSDTWRKGSGWKSGFI